jgi:phytoene synthase
MSASPSYQLAMSISPHAVLTDAEMCQRITRAHARTFSLASRFLAPHKRRAAQAIYAFCRIADDIVDEADARGDAETSRELARFERALRDALAGSPEGPVFRELAHVVEQFSLPHEPLFALLDAISHDVHPREYESWCSLATYCCGVAATVGEMCAQIFGMPGAPGARHAALAHARTLGIAMQLTNILRDVGEDAARGRCYLPNEDLASFGLSRSDVLARRISASDARWRSLIAYEVGRARSLYESAAPGLAMVDDDARLCTTLCAHGYAAILGALEHIGYDSLTRRARVSNGARATIVWRAWRAARSAARPLLVEMPPLAIASLAASRGTLTGTLGGTQP